ncbi:NADPH-dependent ferric siderophore reductase [Rhodococcus sp. 27YEA15]|uniref:siderophore-interacting protein n=1 Tax=Rhodococcus sp. 27YEA15 TaxID=3156259 RepID=UPI003C7AE45A
MPVITPSRRVELPIVLRKLDILRVEDVTPSMRRLTLGGTQLGAFRSGEFDVPAFTTAGADDYVKIFLPEPGSSSPVLPEQHDGHLHWPKKPAPVARAYTVRRFDSAAGELDLDFVLHGHGPAGNWARAAAPGDSVHLAGPKASTITPVGADWWLLVGDATALPAVGHFVDTHTDPAALHAVVLVDGPGEEQRNLAGVTWVHRTGGVADAELIGRAVREKVPAGGDGWIWVAGEAAIVREVRGIAKSLGLGKEQLDATGYWRDQSHGSAFSRLRALRDQAVDAVGARLG